MTGRYVDQSRSVSCGPVRYRYAQSYTKIDPNLTPWQDASAIFASPRQETRSWRTKREVDPNLQSFIDEDSRSFRNGFTTFDPQYDRGHTFRTRKTTFKLSHPDVDLVYFDKVFGMYRMYQGALIPNPVNYPQPVINWLDGSQVADRGQRALLNCAPTSPQAHVATTLGELISDGLPQMMTLPLLKERAKLVRGAGSEYLNVAFGWAPLIKDLQGITSSMLRASKTLSQLQRDSGKVVRRRFAFPQSVTNTASIVNSSNGLPLRFVDGNQLAPGRGSSAQAQVQSDYEKSWFSGSFSYVVPGYGSFADTVATYEKQAQILLGGRMDPESLWELAPWSWLVDWKFKLGQLLSAAQLPADGLVVRYGYLMTHRVSEVTWNPVEPVRFKNDWAVTPYLTLRTETKERHKSTPYGFATDVMSNLSAYQWSILAALGMTRSPRTLRQVS